MKKAMARVIDATAHANKRTATSWWIARRQVAERRSR